MNNSMPMSDEEWQAQMDANTLAEANVINGDQTRLDAASKAADKMAEDKLEEAIAMKRVASRYPSLKEGG